MNEDFHFGLKIFMSCAVASILLAIVVFTLSITHTATIEYYIEKYCEQYQITGTVLNSGMYRTYHASQYGGHTVHHNVIMVDTELGKKQYTIQSSRLLPLESNVPVIVYTYNDEVVCTKLLVSEKYRVMCDQDRYTIDEAIKKIKFGLKEAD